MRCAVIILLFLIIPAQGYAQFSEGAPEQHGQSPSPRGALLRSFVMPGWGHYYADKTSWNRGKIHLAADVVMILSYAGLLNRANTLENHIITQANAGAGISLKGQSRQIELAVANFNSLAEYNDYQLRTRNWDKLIPENSRTAWQWDSREDRHAFQNTRERAASAKNQLPAILGLMVANRVLSGIDAFTRARNRQFAPELAFSYLNEFGEPGITARFTVGF